ncbi:MAG: EMC3/TMCO1 family protein [Candidatus Aenigmatarchaeota archaeon]|jgi:uncharacterized membrane protein (DUF106 family)
MITSQIAKTADLILNPLLMFPPLFSLILLSFLSSLIILLFQRRIFSKENVKNLRRRVDELREYIVKNQNKNKDEIGKLINEMIKLNLKLMKENLKVMLLSIFLGIIFFSWVSFHYSNYYLNLPFPILSKLNLVYFYLILCIVFGVVMSKFLEVR